MKNFVLASILCVLPTLSNAASLTMECKVRSQERSWIAETIYFEYDEARDVAHVSDAIVLHFEDRPIVAEVSEDSGKKLVMKWDIVARNRGQTTKMKYRLAYFKGNNKVTVSAKPHGYTNNFAARGKCRPFNQPLPTS